MLRTYGRLIQLLVGDDLLEQEQQERRTSETSDRRDEQRPANVAGLTPSKPLVPLRAEMIWFAILSLCDDLVNDETGLGVVSAP